MRLVEASLVLLVLLLSFVALSRDVLLRGVRTGEMLRIEVGADAVLLKVDEGPVLALAEQEEEVGFAWLLEPLTLRSASIAIFAP